MIFLWYDKDSLNVTAWGLRRAKQQVEALQKAAGMWQPVSPEPHLLQ